MRLRSAILLFALAPLPASADDSLDATFEILRKGAPIGFHSVNVEPTADGYRVETRIEMKVKFGPLPVYRYEHVSREEWKSGAVVSIESRTNDNGDRQRLSARRENGVLLVDGTSYQGAAPDGAVPSSYWNKAIVEATALLNTQNGEVIDVTVTPRGVTRSPGDTPAEHFELAGTVALNLWYDGARWVGSNFTIDGEELTYRPVASETERSRIFAQLSERLADNEDL